MGQAPKFLFGKVGSASSAEDEMVCAFRFQETRPVLPKRQARLISELANH